MASQQAALIILRRRCSAGSMKAFSVSVGATLLLVLLSFGGPESALAEQFPFCSSDGAPQVGDGFQTLTAQLGNRIGVPAECQHAEATTGDIQQHTSTGLLYWRKSTNTPSFTDGAEHWAIRGTQILHWTLPDADPPPNAQVS